MLKDIKVSTYASCPIPSVTEGADDEAVGQEAETSQDRDGVAVDDELIVSVEKEVRVQHCRLLEAVLMKLSRVVLNDHLLKSHKLLHTMSLLLLVMLHLRYEALYCVPYTLLTHLTFFQTGFDA